jgi:hypothetical protein
MESFLFRKGFPPAKGSVRSLRALVTWQYHFPHSSPRTEKDALSASPTLKFRKMRVTQTPRHQYGTALSGTSLGNRLHHMSLHAASSCCLLLDAPCRVSESLTYD